jgi:hypothetical protein
MLLKAYLLASMFGIVLGCALSFIRDERHQLGVGFLAVLFLGLMLVGVQYL